MLTNEQMTAAMGAVRDQVLAIMADHERTMHDGEPCMGNRCSAIAHLAHCLGVRGEAWQYAHKLLMEYDLMCKQAYCKHGESYGREGN